ncbi:hypothetical protein [Amycolatopsis albispora]|uniref:hypothetical protein n=1 Tax=Amycolatopsis albispora TaxID=1804986 RepID=UPI0013B3E243|nr:hypothetical protein [Amycolatopsis albispora]
MTDVEPVPVLTELSARERELVRAARHGDELVCGEVSSNLLAATSDPDQQVRARLIRELLRGEHGELDPHGVRLRGARIVGHLDLDHLETSAGLELTGCAFTWPITAFGAQLPRLILTGSRIIGLYARGLRVTGDLVLEDGDVRDSVQLSGAHIDGALRASRLRGGTFDADDAKVDGDLRLAHANIISTSAHGAIRLHGAHIGGQLSAEHLRCDNPSGIAVNAEHLDIGGGLYLDNAHLTGHSPLGAIRLHSARIGGQLNLTRLNCANAGGPALSAERIQVTGSLHLAGARYAGRGENGTVRLVDAHIGSQVNAEHLHCDNPSGVALLSDDLKVDGDLHLTHARLTGNSAQGAIRLHSAHIGGQLNAEGLHCDNPGGSAFVGANLTVLGNLYLISAWFTANSEHSAVCLHDAQIRGLLNARWLRGENTSGSVLCADRLRAERSVTLRHARLTGDRQAAAVHLLGAHISGQLVLRDTGIDNGSAIGLDLEDTRVDGTVFFPAELVCPEPWGGSCRYSRSVGLDGFTFDALSDVDWPEWVHLIRFHTGYYAPSPYQKLAVAERAAGHDSNARHILIAQQRDLHRRSPGALGGPLARWGHRLWGALTGYGYRTRRTAAALLLALIAAGGFGLWAGHVDTRPGYAAERTAASGTPGQQCTPVELIGLGLDRGLPLAPTGLRTRCDLDTATTPGQWFTVAIWLVQAAVWGLATLAVAGYTGLVRKTA